MNKVNNIYNKVDVSIKRDNLINVDFPKIGEGTSFEKFCEALWKNTLSDEYQIETFGRNGQTQHGVDVACISKDEVIGIQSKRRKKLTTDMIDVEINKAKKFSPKLNKFIIATTLDKDAKLQSHVFNKSIQNQNNGLFKVEIIFWDGITDKILNESDVDLYKNFFPHQSLDVAQTSNILNYGITQFDNGNYNSAINCLNTIKNSGSVLSNQNKYEFCILEGQYLELCGDYKKAGGKFIESYEYSFKDVKAKYYKSLGLYLTGEIEESKKICKEIIKEDSLNESAYSLLIRIDDGVNIPEEINNSSKINYNRGLNAYLNGDYEVAYNFFKNLDSKTPIQWINCIDVRFKLFLKDDCFPVIISQEDYDKLLKIESIFQENMDCFSDNILIHYLNQLLGLMSINHLLNHYDLLKENVERGLRIDENNKALLFYKAVLLEKEGKYDDALDILKNNPDVLDSFRLITLISIRDNNYQQIIDYGEVIIDTLDKSSQQYLFCQYALIDAYIQLSRPNDAKRLIDSDKNECRHNLLKSKLYTTKSDKLKCLLESYKNINQGFIIDKLQLASELARLNEFEYAISIYESILDLKIFYPMTNDLAYCYYHNEDYDKLIELSEYFINNNEYYQYLIDFEINAYLKISDFDKVLELVDIYLEHVENNYSMRILKAKICLFKEKYDEVDDFINEEHDFNNLNLTQCLEIYALCKYRINDTLKLFEILYAIRNAHENEINIHMIYTQEVLDSKFSFINPLKVEYGRGVLLKYAGKEELVFVTRDNPDLHKFNQFDKILNHKKGDKITLETNLELEILEVYNKFDYAFKDSFEIVQINSSNYLKIYHFESIEEHLDQIKEITLEKHNRLTSLKNQYQNSFKLIQVFSEVSGMDMYDSYFYLKEGGLKSFSMKEYYQVPIEHELILDTTSLLTIHLLNIEDKIAKNYEIHISTSEYFLLKHILDSVRPNLSCDLVVGYDKNDEFSAGNPNYKAKYDFISKIIKWIDKYCKITESKSLFRLTKKDKDNINQIPYSNIRENILLAYDDYILVSDDLDMKKLINQFFNVKTCGTLTVIVDMHNKQIITDEEFDELILKLYECNFKDIMLNAELLIKSIKNKNYNLFIKFIFDYILNPTKYLNFNWDYIIKNLNTQNIYERILFEMIIKLFSNIIFINYCNPLLIKLNCSDDEKYVASKQSNIFHDIDCSFAKKISKQNIIQFINKEDAIKKGYAACNRCIK